MDFYELNSAGYPSDLGKLWQFFGVRLDPDQLEVTAGFHPQSPKAQATAPVTAASSAVGRPRKEYWEPLLVGIIGQLHSGDLQPKRQADIEAAMHQWLLDNGHSGSEAQVRTRARSVWDQVKP
ncbi:hypothetical protein [Brevundimonas sp. TWP2-3-2]|uniref:hypothetical protein n=1 Tax=unclassified Brevundimonas TaxID=2622653 RepID=UPI003CFA6C1B